MNVYILYRITFIANLIAADFFLTKNIQSDVAISAHQKISSS